METNTILLIVGAAILGLIIGFIISKTIEKNNVSKLLKSAKKEADRILKDAKHDGEGIKKDKIFQAKEKFLELKSDHEKVILTRDKKMAESEKRIRDKEFQISSELNKNNKLNDDIEVKIKDYNYRLDFLDKRKVEVEKVHKSQIQQLEVISSLSAEDAKSQLIESLKGEAKSDAMA